MNKTHLVLSAVRSKIFDINSERPISCIPMRVYRILSVSSFIEIKSMVSIAVGTSLGGSMHKEADEGVREQ